MCRFNKSATRTVSRAELGNLLHNFKTYILGSLNEKIDILEVQNKQNAKNSALSIFCPKCRRKHALRECPLYLKSVETCVICAENHDSKEFRLILSLKVFYQE